MKFQWPFVLVSQVLWLGIVWADPSMIEREDVIGVSDRRRQIEVVPIPGAVGGVDVAVDSGVSEVSEQQSPTIIPLAPVSMPTLTMDASIASTPSPPPPPPPPPLDPEVALAIAKAVQTYNRVKIAHAVLASIAWLVFFPVGGILIRVLDCSNVVWIHSIVQSIGYVVFGAGAGCGIWMATRGHFLTDYHPIIGMILLGSLAIQPLSELINHFFYHKYPRTIYLAHLHLWFGRLLITVGIIQGFLGFVFSESLPKFEPSAKQASWPKIVYGVTAIVVWVLYICLAIVWPEVRDTFSWFRKKGDNERAGRKSGGEEMQGLRDRDAVDRTGMAVGAVEMRT